MSLLVVGGWCGLVYLGTQPYLFCQHLQYSVIIDIDITITVTGATIVEMNLILSEDQEVFGTDQSFVKVLLIWKIEKCFILGILVPMVYNL